MTGGGGSGTSSTGGPTLGERARSIRRVRREHLRRYLAPSAGPGVMVLGMHRSGTSAVARTLSMLGLSPCLDEDMVRGPWNPHGHYESQRLMNLDDRLLKEMGCRWWYPPHVGPRYVEQFERIRTSRAHARREFLKVHPRSPWVWKDPRACLLMPFWRPTLGARAAGVIVFRRPLEVAMSIERRHGVPLEFGLALWERYNRLLLVHCAGMDVLVMSYEEILRAPSRWAELAQSFVRELRIDAGDHPLSEVATAVDPPTSRSEAPHVAEGQVPPSASALHAALEDSAGRHTVFEPPALEDEPESVQGHLETVGPTKRLEWRAPAEGAPEPGTGNASGNPQK